jgi:periplasmic protein CpxP/Spy
MKKIKTTIFLSTMLLALSAFAWQSPTGQEGKEDHGHMGKQSLDDHVKMVSEKLNLSDDQQSKVKAILVDSHQQMHTIMDDASLSQEDKKSKLHSLHEATHSKIREVLNDDQKKKFDVMLQEMQDRSKEGKTGDNTPK